MNIEEHDDTELEETIEETAPPPSYPRWIVYICPKCGETISYEFSTCTTMSHQSYHMHDGVMYQFIFRGII